MPAPTVTTKPRPNPGRIWSLLHRTILNIPPARLPIFPLLSGTVWFVTLTSLLARWITRGMRPYPGQINSSVPFISDIASFELKPLFLVGASITAAGFFWTVAAVHVVRFEPGFALVKHSSHEAAGQGQEQTQIEGVDVNEDEEDETTLKTLRLISLVSIFSTGLASLTLTLLAVMDTFRYSIAHDICLRLCFAGLAVQALGTAIVYGDQKIQLGLACCGRRRRTRDEQEQEIENELQWSRNGVRRTSRRVRIFETLSTILLGIEIGLATAFLSLSISDKVDTHYRKAAILEWVIAYLGTVYLWLFVGFLDRITFTGYTPSTLYQGTNIPESENGMEPSGTGPNGGCGSGIENTEANSETERAPLLQNAHLSRKYT